MTDTFEELRVIAKDGGRLSASDRDLIALAADELEHAQLLLIRTQADLIEANGHRIALSERVLEMKRQALVVPVTFTSPPLWRLSLGFPQCP